MKCPHCGHVIPSAQAAWQRDAVRLGLCAGCRNPRGSGGTKWYCKTCARARAEQARQRYREKPTSGKTPEHKKANRRWRRKMRDEGLCQACHRPHSGPRDNCAECSVERAANERQRRRDKKGG